jgi:hypothetical protein
LLRKPEIRKVIIKIEAPAYKNWAAGNQSLEDFASALNLRFQSSARACITDVAKKI